MAALTLWTLALVFYLEIAMNLKLKTSMNDSNIIPSLLGGPSCDFSTRHCHGLETKMSVKNSNNVPQPAFLGGFRVIFQLDSRLIGKVACSNLIYYTF